MSYRALNWAWSSKLPRAQKFVLVALADMADENESCYPGQERLASMTGTSVSTVHRALKSLEEYGMISRQQRRGSDGMRTSDRYQLHVNRSFCPPDVTGQIDRQTEEVTGQMGGGHRSNDPYLTGHSDGVTPREPLEEPPGTLRIDEKFEEFWTAYPIRKGKEPARKSFEKALKSGAAFEAIMGGLAAYKRELGQLVGGKTLDGRNPKWAQGWLNDRRWEDEPDGPSLDDEWRNAMGAPADPCTRLGHLWITDGTCGRCGTTGGPR